MLGDTLLDYLACSNSPSVLFDHDGSVLYKNRALQRLEWATSALHQLLAYVKDGSCVPSTCVTSRPAIKRRKASHDYSSATTSGADRSIHGTSTAILQSDSSSRPALRRQDDNAQDTLRTGSAVAAAGHLTGAAATSGATTPKPSTNRLEDYPYEGFAFNAFDSVMPNDRIRTLWRITVSVDKRIIAIAQDSETDPFTDLTSEETSSVRQSVPSIERSWRQQTRFQGLTNGGGTMGELIRNFDWSQHPLGAIETWPQARVEMISLLLRCPLPMTAYQEDEAFVIYNDAYIEVLGPHKHPRCLGKPAREVWSEIWNLIEEPLADAMKGIPIERVNDRLFFDRLRDGSNPNTMEEVYATWVYLPYWGHGRYIGNLHLLFDEAGRMSPIAARRIEGIADLGARLSSSRNTIDLCRNTLDVLSGLEYDLPYCLAYTKVAYEPPAMLDGKSPSGTDPHIVSISSAGSTSSKDFEEQQNIHIFALQETVGVAFDSRLAPSRLIVDLDSATGSPSGEGSLTPTGVTASSRTPAWQAAMAEVLRTGEAVHLTDIQDWLVGVPHRGLPGFTPYRATVLPLRQGTDVLGCIILLLNPALAWDADFQRFIDITARQISLSLSMVRTFEQEVQRAEELAALDRAKTSFFTSVSHELRTPLTLILGPVKSLIDDTTLTRAQASSVSMVYRNARRLLRLVNSILDFARAEAGKLSSQFAATALGPVTMELASSFRSAIEGAGMQFVTEDHTHPDTIVWIDIDKWEKIVFNLISNAFKFTTSGIIKVKTAVDLDNFYVEVQDTGVGIPPDELSSIFERFVRVENSQARSVEGSGIGLSLTMELVRLHGGKIGVESVWQKGSTFKIKIPLGNTHLPKAYIVNPSTLNISRSVASSDEYRLHTSDEISAFGTKSESAADTEESPDSSKLKDLWPPLLFGERQRARILLADDNDDMRRFIKGILQPFADIEEVPDGQAAWDVLQHELFDLVLSDITMPRLNGFQLLAKIRADEYLKTKPVILLSARAGEEAGVESLSSGADDFLNKPFSSKELILRVHSHLQLAAIRSELETRVVQRTAALEEAKETFKRLSELLQVGVHRSDRNGNIIWANKKWFTVLGLEEGEWDNWGSRIHPGDLAEALAYYTEAVESGESHSRPIEMRLLSFGDQIVEIMYELRAELTPDGECTGFVGVFSDVSVLRALERERISLEQARRQEAEEMRQQQETFIDVICHELRNPLNAIYNSAELLGDSLRRMTQLGQSQPELQAVFVPLEADLKEDIDAVETILLSSRHQKRIADDVLHISKIAGNLVQLVAADWQPEATLRNTLKMFQLESAAKSISLTYEIDPSFAVAGSTVVGDEGRFTQVVVNLLSNAIKFVDSTETKVVRLRLGATPILEASILQQLFEAERFQLDDMTPLCRQYGQVWSDGQLASQDCLLHVAIYDSGPGMSAEEQAKIFRRYAQASPKTYRAFGGVGLGLWISRKLIELHGGAVSLQSTAGVGTVFRFYIKVGRKQATAEDPRIAGKLAAPATDQSLLATDAPLRSRKTDRVRVDGRKPRILVVEDNDVNTKVLVRLLTTLKCDTHTAGDGVEALAQLQTLHQSDLDPDLVLMDLEMPIMDGLTATKNIRKLEESGAFGARRLGIVAVSANARDIYAQLSAEAGMDSFMRKPYSRAQLTEILQQFIDF